MTTVAISRSDFILTNVITPSLPNIEDLGIMRVTGLFGGNTLTGVQMYDEMKNLIKSKLTSLSKTDKLMTTEKFRLIDTMGGVVFDSVMSSPDSVIQNTQPNYKNGTLGTGVHFDFFFAEALANMGATDQGICHSMPNSKLVVTRLGTSGAPKGYFAFQKSSVPKI